MMGGRRPASGAGSYFNASSNPRVAATGQMIPSKSSSRIFPQGFIHILLVEDVTSDTSFVDSVLHEGQETDFSIFRVSDLSAANKIALTVTFDMVILHLNLPDSHGLETLSQFRSVIGDVVPILAFTEVEDDGVRETVLYGFETEFLAVQVFFCKFAQKTT